MDETVATTDVDMDPLANTPNVPLPRKLVFFDVSVGDEIGKTILFVLFLVHLNKLFVRSRPYCL